MKPLKDCEFTAFISYAHADDAAWFGWIRQFRDELERSLGAMLRGVRLPRMHLSGENGPVAGALSQELQERVAKAFAMIIVVHDNYAQSAWCLKELEYFKSLFGDDGFRQRLYIVALSESAISAVSGGKDWQRLMPDSDQVWLSFYEESDRTRPVDVYLAPGLVSPSFRAPFERLRADFAAKLRQAVADDASPRGAASTQSTQPLQGAPLPSTPTAAGRVVEVAPTAQVIDVLLPGFAPAVPAAAAPPAAAGQVSAGLGRVLLGFVPKGSEAALSPCRQALLAAGVQLQAITQDVVYGSFSEFDDAEHLVLPFDDSAPMMPIVGAGGHLQVLHDAWLKQGRPANQVHWLDLRTAPPPVAQWQGAAAYVASLGLAGCSVQALLKQWLPAAPAAGSLATQPVRIYIESNRHERTLWEPLGEQIRLRWQQLCAEMAPTRVPPLSLRARGLPVEEIDRFPNLDDADGVVLLWGRKTSEALVAQINKVEGKLSIGHQVPPGIVAYLMPPQAATESVPAWGWQVLRFMAADENNIDVVEEERDELTRFLRKVFKRRQQRETEGQ